MAQIQKLTYECPKCGHAFTKDCIFAANKGEYERCKKQLSTPFLEDTGRNICLHQMECPNPDCSESRQYPVLIEGYIES